MSTPTFQTPSNDIIDLIGHLKEETDKNLLYGSMGFYRGITSFKGIVPVPSIDPVMNVLDPGNLPTTKNLEIIKSGGSTSSSAFTEINGNIFVSDSNLIEDGNSVLITTPTRGHFYYFWLYHDLRPLLELIEDVLSVGSKFNTNQQGSNYTNNKKTIDEYLQLVTNNYFLLDLLKDGGGTFTPLSEGISPKITLPGRVEYTEIQENIHSVYKVARGVSNNFLKTKVCINDGNNYFTSTGAPTRDLIGANQVYINWCGCFAPPPDIPQAKGLTTECDPLCQNQSSIKLVDDSGNEKECNGLLCILDNISIAGDGSGNVNITQICPQCLNGGQCRCVVDVTIPGVLNKITGGNGNSMADNTTFRQYCPGAECIDIDPITREAKVVSCGQGVNVQIKTDAPGKSFWIMLGLFAFILLLYILAAKTS